MAKGKDIVLSVPGRGHHVEGYCEGAITPGECVMADAAVAAVGGRLTYEAANVGDADGARCDVIVADIDKLQGRTRSTAYSDTERFFGYRPAPGDELNVLVKASVGDLDVGDRLIIEAASGQCIATTGTPETEPFEVLEDSDSSTAARWVWVKYIGN